MGATRAVFAPQFTDFPELIVPAWIEPERGETLAAYAKRLAAVIDPGMPCVIGGMSFGGMVATEMCKHLDAKALVLIASLQHPDERPRRARWVCTLVGRMPAWLVWCGQLLARVLAPIAWCLTTRNGWSLYRQAWGNSATLLAWSARALAHWEASDTAIPCPVFRLHGGRDPALPAKRCATGDDVDLVDGGRHVLTLSHPARVRAIINRAIG